ncbi:MAG TPA: winged helix-turn-helix domain-containing protein [Gaiellaceae bacterium]|nr:winged helix-turn-helix domain-containing protein [Gaiellaceae bacterium]
MTVARRTRPRSFVGRNAELATLDALTTAGEHAVAYLHGIAGIGKSALAAALGERLAVQGTSVVVLDCRAIEPTSRGLAAALETSEYQGHPPANGGNGQLLVLDHYEVFRLMDTWLRQEFAPALPRGTRLLLISREPPVAAWFALPGGFRSMALGPMPERQAVDLLRGLGFRRVEGERLNRIARGHPLALTLAVAGAAEHPELDLEEAASSRVVDELSRLYLNEVRDPLTRRALEAASVVRRVTEPLLAALLDDEDDAGDALERLRELPFVDAGRDGLVVHEAVREAIGGLLRATNPVRHRAHRRAAWHELRAEVSDAAPSELWRYTADMLYLIENPVVREAFFPSGAQPLAVEPARPDDAASVSAIARRHEPPDAAELLERWWSEEPETFSVVRDRDGVATGFFSLLTTDHIRRGQMLEDPVVAAWARHLRDEPLPRGQVVLGLRRWLDAERGELPCPSQAACWLDVKRAYMALRPALRRMYVVVHDVPTYWPVVEKLGFRPLADGQVEIAGRPYASVALDFGPGSVDGWLARLVGAELGIDEERSLDGEARELSVRGQRIALTPLEFGLFAHLRECEGRAVSRAELLREVWGTEFTGGSNVVDAVVRMLRRKLGPAAPAIETVRGTGYRLRADWRSALG